MSASESQPQVPIDHERVLGHAYDGIEEYDNPLPGWWVGLFVASIVFALAYWVFYHGGGPGQSETAVYADDMAAYNEQQAKQAARAGTVDESLLARFARDPAVIAEMKPLFLSKCMPCHGPHGEGKIGPNLTDLHQIHGKGRVDLFQIIRDGVVAKGMLAWGKILQPAELMKLAAYVSTLRGTFAAGGKAPQGEPVTAFGN
ncbi:MAG: c-type cytochrome [Proteobacteria bacterium]|nr:c-type cytochrome [Pseudomonadota bacterium]